MLKLADRVRAALGFDSAFAFAFIGRIVPALGGLATTLLVATRFEQVEQGYFYAFSSLLTLQVFVELGLGQVVVQFAAHEFAHLSYDPRSGVSGDAASLSRLTSLARLAASWFAAGALVLVIILVLGGLAIFSGDPDTAWQGPWFALCAITAVNLALMPAQFLLEGCNQLRPLYAIRGFQALATQGALCAAIAGGAGLWSNAIGVASGVVCVLALQIGRLRPFYRSLLQTPTGPRVHWRNEMWSMQWRIAISSVSGFFAYSVVTPLAFRLLGPVQAGQLGMSMTLINAMTNTSVLPISLKVPSMGIAVAQRDYRALDRIALRATLASAGLWLCGAVLLAAGLRIAHIYDLQIAERLLPEHLFWIWLLASAQLPCAGTPIAAYLRAHKREPFALFGVVYSLATVIGFVAFGILWGLGGMAVANLLSLALATPVIVAIMVRSRRRWQSTAS